MSSKSFYLALEQRILLDAAGLSTAVDVAVDGQNSFTVPSAEHRKQVDNLLTAFSSQESAIVSDSHSITLIIADATILDVDAVVGDAYADSEIRYFDCQTDGFERLTEIIELVPGLIRSVHIIYPALASAKIRLPRDQFTEHALLTSQEEEVDGVVHWRIESCNETSPHSDTDVLQVSGNLIAELIGGDDEAGGRELSIGNFRPTESTKDAVISGLFGVLNIDLESGEYSYRLNTVSPLIQVLEADEAPVENFSYTITRPSAASISALLVLTVKNRFDDTGNDAAQVETIRRKLQAKIIELNGRERESRLKSVPARISANVIPGKEGLSCLSIQNSLRNLAGENQFLPLVYTLLHEVKNGSASTYLVSLSISDPATSRLLITNAREKGFKLLSNVSKGDLIFETDGSFTYSPPVSGKPAKNPVVCQESFCCQVGGDNANSEISVTISIVENRVAGSVVQPQISAKPRLKSSNSAVTAANVAGTLKRINSAVHIVAGQTGAIAKPEPVLNTDELTQTRPNSQKNSTKVSRMTITLGDQVIESQEGTVFFLKEESFEFKSGSLKNIEARGGHSAQLPSFIGFDSRNLRFEVDVKSALQRAWNCIPLRVKATSTSGEEASGDFTIIISDAVQESAMKELKLDYVAGLICSGGGGSLKIAQPSHSAMSELEAYRLAMKQADRQYDMSQLAVEEKETKSTSSTIESNGARKGIVELLKDLVGAR